MVAPLTHRLLHTTPWNLFDELHRELDEFLGSDIHSPATSGAPATTGTVPAMNIAGDENLLRLELEVPGLSATDLDISLEGRSMIIKGERSTEPEAEKPTWLLRQRRGGSFERRVELPYEIEEDGIVARVEAGLLQLTLPRREASKPRKITIEA